MQSKKILGVRVDFGLSIKDVLDIFENKLLRDNKNHIVCTTNPEFIIDAQKDKEFKKIINESSLSTPDGAGIIFAKNYLKRVENFKKDFLFPARAFLYGIWLGISSFSQNKKIKGEKTTGVDLAYKVCELSAKKGYSVFFLGGRIKNAAGKLTEVSDSDMSNMAADQMRKLYPGVNIVGSTSKFNRGPEDDQVTLEYIKNIMSEKSINKIDFLFVAYNHIHQEKWIMRNKDKIPAKICIGCGGTFDFIVGNCTLPPPIYDKNNLGWVYRLFKQPWRFKRIIKAFPMFPYKVFIKSIIKEEIE